MDAAFPGTKPRRRTVLGVGAAAALPAWAQRPGAAKPLAVAQIVDTSAAQQDVSKDFLVGSRAAWQDINARGGLRGRPVLHLALEVDGTPASLRGAVALVHGNPACVLLCGTSGDPAAFAVARQLQQDSVGLAHVAPWLQNSSLDVDDRTFPIFAARQEQVAHAMRSLTTMGVAQLGAVYATPREAALYREDVERVAGELKLGLRSYGGDGTGLSMLGQSLGAGTPAVLLFVGGTPELAQFTLGLQRQQRQRYVVALADVNLQTLMQMGAARGTPVIATQAVPMVTASLPVVRQYRDVLARLFDEPPTPLSLAGFIAVRYAFEVLQDIAAEPTRAAVLAAFQRRAPQDMGGYRVAFDPRRRSATYVTQSMLTTDGRVVG
jgi:hypothetical protein